MSDRATKTERSPDEVIRGVSLLRRQSNMRIAHDAWCESQREIRERMERWDERMAAEAGQVLTQDGMDIFKARLDADAAERLLKVKREAAGLRAQLALSHIKP